MSQPPASGLTRRRALALGAAAGAATLLRGSVLPQPALARTRDLVVPRDAFGRDGRTGPLAVAPFVLLGVRAPLALGAALDVRTRRRGGSWSAWNRLHAGLGHGPDHGGAPRSGEPLWTGAADELELRASRRPAGPVRVAFVDVPAPARALLAARAARARTAQIAGAPAIVPRATWATDAAKPRTDPSFGDVQIAVVHHTESSNAYGPEDSAAAVLAIAQFHIDTRGWNDIGYNFVVDRFGTIFEGRAGGIDLPVIGAHAMGFNSVSTGISVMGSFMDVEAPGAAVAAVARLIGWKLPFHGIPVTGDTVVVSGGGSQARYPYGQSVTLPRICGHRDVGSTNCPGDQFYLQLPALRTRTAAHAQPIVLRPMVSLAASTPRSGYGRPVAFSGTVLGTDRTPQVGGRVRIAKQSPSGAWVTIARAVTDAQGDYVVSAPWRRAGLVRAEVGDATSLPVSVAVVPALRVTADTTQLASGERVTLSGSLRPKGTIEVVIQRRSGGRWRIQRRFTRRAGTSFAVPVRFGLAGSYRVLVSGRVGDQRVHAAPIALKVGGGPGGAVGGVDGT